jgi:tetratricopeptide (TPR) repeat protein
MNLLKHDFIIREPLLVAILVLITVVFSAFTHTYSQAYDRRRAVLGMQWFERGRHDLSDNRPAAAIEDFRTALLYDPRNWEFGMHLANALMAANRTDQALNYYLSLWQRNPSNGLVNLQIARLYARKEDTGNAERYFNGAVFGDWPENADDSRRAASLELIHFYLERGDNGHAESQLILLSGNLPEDPQLHTRVANLYARVGDDQRALTQFREALTLDPSYAPAIAGAGEAAFRMGDFRMAQSYLTRALRLNPSNTTTKNLLTILEAVFALNPYQQGISEAQKIQRTLHAFEVVGNRLQTCSNSQQSSAASSVSPFLERWKELKAIANTRFLTQHPEEMETLLDFTANAEKLAQSHCGEPTAEDSALLAIAHQREMANQ